MTICLDLQEFGWNDTFMNSLEKMDQAKCRKKYEAVVPGWNEIKIVGVFPYNSKNDNPCLRWVCQLINNPAITICRYSTLLPNTLDNLARDFAAFDLKIDNFSKDVQPACIAVIGRSALGNIAINNRGMIIQGFKKL
jgi:hypothetical protein